MTDAATFLALARALAQTAEVPHSGRRAFRRRVIFATLASDEASANLRLSPQDQDHWCALLPQAVAPVPGGWGAQGWTNVALTALDEATLALLLDRAWDSAGPPQRPRH